MNLPIVLENNISRMQFSVFRFTDEADFVVTIRFVTISNFIGMHMVANVAIIFKNQFA